MKELVLKDHPDVSCWGMVMVGFFCHQAESCCLQNQVLLVPRNPAEREEYQGLGQEWMNLRWSLVGHIHCFYVWAEVNAYRRICCDYRCALHCLFAQQEAKQSKEALKCASKKAKKGVEDAGTLGQCYWHAHRVAQSKEFAAKSSSLSLVGSGSPTLFENFKTSQAINLIHLHFFSEDEVERGG